MKITTRVETATTAHATIRVFVDGVSAGLLTARPNDIAALAVRLETDAMEMLSKFVADVNAGLDSKLT